MHHRRARVLVVDNAEGELSSRLAEGFALHDVEFTRDRFDAIHRIDSAGRPHDIIFCDLASKDTPGLWAYLALVRAAAAERMVFVASTPLPSETAAFVQCIPNQCVDLPVDADALDALVNRRAAHRGPSLARTGEPHGEGSVCAARSEGMRMTGLRDRPPAAARDRALSSPRHSGVLAAPSAANDFAMGVRAPVHRHGRWPPCVLD